ncbi:MAG: OmpA family protein [Pseudomonadota bacterium]
MKRFLVTGIALALTIGATQTANASDASRKEMVGVGAGAVIGGAVGGPPGIVIGAALGAVFGDRSHQKDVKVEKLSAELAHTSGELAVTSAALRDEKTDSRLLREELTTLDESGVRELYTLLGKGLEFNLPFRTDETELPQDLDTRIASIAELLSATPGLAVQIDGYADPRGSVEYNAALSLQRAETVRGLLMDAGISPGSIQTFGRGEPIIDQADAVRSADELALQRRVTVTFYRTDTAEHGVANYDVAND